MIYVLYHASCPDGFGAALAAWIEYRDRATYLPVQYGQPLPEIPDGSEVYIVDFSYDRETLELLRARTSGLQVLDHHKTAQVALAGLPYAKFDMDKSGAVLAWEFFHPDRSLPLLFRYLQDRDLWRWELPFSREVSAFLSIQPRDFERWHALSRTSEGLSEPLPTWVSLGEAVLWSQRTQVDSLCDHAVTALVGSHKVPAVNSPLLQSEIGEELCKRHSDAPFAAAYFVMGGTEVVWSLRSKGGFDVSAVAKSFGGGGHTAAAGFKVPIQSLGGMFDVASLG